MTRHRRRKPSSRPAAGTGERQGDRLQKVLAAAGLGSRRDCEELIVTGRVEIDGRPVNELGTRVDPLTQEIRVDGVALPRPRRVHFMLNKPPGVVCTNDDPSGRMRAIDFVKSGERLFTVGRLDRSSEGMILVTNDGELANQLTHPRYGVEKRYLVRVVGSPNPVIFEKLRHGIRLAEGIARVSDIRIRKRTAKFSDLEIVLQEGRNREIRRILARIGHKVVRLKRIAIGPLRMGELPVGESRPLSRDEVKRLLDAVQAGKKKKKLPRKPSPEQRSAGPRRPDQPARKPSADSKVKPDWTKPTAPEPIELEPDEVEVTDLPLNLPPGSIIGGDDDWSSEPNQKPHHRPGKKRR